MYKRRNKITPISEEQKMTAKLMEIRIKLEDYVCKNKTISKAEAQQYLNEIVSYIPKCENDVRTLQVINKYTGQMKRILEQVPTHKDIIINENKCQERNLVTLTKTMSISDPINCEMNLSTNKLKDTPIENDKYLCDFNNSPTIDLKSFINDASMSKIHNTLSQNELKEISIENNKCIYEIENSPTIDLDTFYNNAYNNKDTEEDIIIRGDSNKLDKSILDILPADVEVNKQKVCFSEDIDILSDSQYIEESNMNEVLNKDKIINIHFPITMNAPEVHNVSSTIVKNYNKMQKIVLKSNVINNSDYKEIIKDISTSEFLDSQSILQDYIPNKSNTLTSNKVLISTTSKINNNKHVKNNVKKNKAINSVYNIQKNNTTNKNKKNKTKQTKIISFLTSNRNNPEVNVNKDGVIIKNNNIALNNTCQSNLIKKKAIRQNKGKKDKTSGDLQVDKLNVEKKVSSNIETQATQVSPVTVTNDCMWIKQIKYVREINENEYCENILVSEEFWTDGSLLPGLCEEDFII